VSRFHLVTDLMVSLVSHSELIRCPRLEKGGLQFDYQWLDSIELTNSSADGWRRRVEREFSPAENLTKRAFQRV
jgi:hypothetical protein